MTDLTIPEAVRKAALLFAFLSLAAFAAAGGDKPRDRVLQPLPITELCPRLRDGHWLRAAIRHCPDGTPSKRFCYHQCVYEAPNYPEAAI